MTFSIIASLFFVQVALAATEADSINLPVLLASSPQYEFYKQQDVCKYTRELAPEKKAALVVVKTHACDHGSQVCLRALANVSDRANLFIQENFQVFHTRFLCNGKECPSIGESTVRKEWDKPGYDPELVVLEPRSCQILFRDFAYNWKGFYTTGDQGTHMYFDYNYVAIKKMLLSKKSVRSLLGIPTRSADDDEKASQEELALINSQVRPQFPQPSLETVQDVSIEQLKAYGLDPKP